MKPLNTENTKIPNLDEALAKSRQLVQQSHQLNQKNQIKKLELDKRLKDWNSQQRPDMPLTEIPEKPFSVHTSSVQINSCNTSGTFYEQQKYKDKVRDITEKLISEEESQVSEVSKEKSPSQDSDHEIRQEMINLQNEYKTHFEQLKTEISKLKQKNKKLSSENKEIRTLQQENLQLKQQLSKLENKTSPPTKLPITKSVRTDFQENLKRNTLILETLEKAYHSTSSKFEKLHLEFPSQSKFSQEFYFDPDINSLDLPKTKKKRNKSEGVSKVFLSKRKLY